MELVVVVVEYLQWIEVKLILCLTGFLLSLDHLAAVLVFYADILGFQKSSVATQILQ